MVAPIPSIDTSPPPDYQDRPRDDFATFLPGPQDYNEQGPAISFTFSFIKILRIGILFLAITNLWFLSRSWSPSVAIPFWILDLVLVVWTSYRILEGLGGPGTKFEAQLGSFNMSFGRAEDGSEPVPKEQYSPVNNKRDMLWCGLLFVNTILAFTTNVWPYSTSTEIVIICFTLS